MALQSAIAELTSGERVTAAAAGGQMIDPPAGQTRYLTARPATDPARAARRFKPPSERAIAIMANDGILPGALAPAGSAAAQLAASLNAGTAAAGATPTRRPRRHDHDDAAGDGHAARDRDDAAARPPPATPRAPRPPRPPPPTATPSPPRTPGDDRPATGAATAPQG